MVWRGKASIAFDTSGTAAVTIVAQCAIMLEHSALTLSWIFPRAKRAHASRLTINFEIFDLRSVSRAFQLYACEQWPPTPKHYIYSPIYLVNACTHPLRIYVCTTSRVPARSQCGVYISPSLPFRSHKLSKRLLPARHAAKERRGRAAAYMSSESCTATSRIINFSRKRVLSAH